MTKENMSPNFIGTLTGWLADDGVGGVCGRNRQIPSFNVRPRVGSRQALTDRKSNRTLPVVKVNNHKLYYYELQHAMESTIRPYLLFGVLLLDDSTRPVIYRDT